MSGRVTAAPVSERPRSPHAPLGLVLLLGALTAFPAMSIDMYLPSLPALAHDLHATAGQAQLTVAAFFTGLALGQLVYGPLSDRVGRRPPLLFGASIYVAASLGCAFAPNVEALIALRFLQALGACAGSVVSRAAVRDRYSGHEMVHVFSLLLLVMGVAPVLAPFLGGQLLLVGGWRTIFGVLTALGGLIGLTVFFRLKESRSAETERQARSESPVAAYLALLRRREVSAYVLAGALSGAALFTYIASAPDLLINTFHVRAQDFGWVFAVNAVGLIGGAQLNARWARTTPSAVILRRALAAGTVCAAALCVAAWSGWGGLVGVLVPTFGVIASMGFTQPNATACAMAVDGRRGGSTSALLGSAGFGVGAVAAGITSLVSDGSARPMAAMILAALLVGQAVLWTLAPRPHAAPDTAASEGSAAAPLS